MAENARQKLGPDRKKLLSDLYVDQGKFEEQGTLIKNNGPTPVPCQ
jgi:hypothetical protein